MLKIMFGSMILVISIYIVKSENPVINGINYLQSPYIYYGQYNNIEAGLCSSDGIYYKDDYTFIICSNGKAHEQPCALGSKNSGATNYQSGNLYHYKDFCNVNLLDNEIGYSRKEIQQEEYDPKYPRVHYSPRHNIQAYPKLAENQPILNVKSAEKFAYGNGKSLEAFPYGNALVNGKNLEAFPYGNAALGKSSYGNGKNLEAFSYGNTALGKSPYGNGKNLDAYAHVSDLQKYSYGNGELLENYPYGREVLGGNDKESIPFDKVTRVY